MKRKRRGLSLLLAVCLLAGLMPAVVFAAPGTSRTSRTASARIVSANGAVQIVDTKDNPTGGIKGFDPAEGSYHYIYYGKWEGKPIKWRVLDTKTNMEAPNDKGLFVLSEELTWSGSGSLAFSTSGSKAWQGSDAQAWCQDFAGASASDTVPDAFSGAELSGILKTNKSDPAYAVAEANSDEGNLLKALSFNKADDILKDDQVFFLSAEEALNKNYGFVKTGASGRRSEALIGSYDGAEQVWWLRSPESASDPYLGMVDAEGYVTSGSGDNGSGALPRPAFNLDLDKVLFTSPAASGTSGRAALGTLEAVSAEASSEWRLTLKDDDRNGTDGFQATLEGGGNGPQAVNTGEKVKIAYSNAKKQGTNEFISAMLLDNVSGDILYYGHIASCPVGGNDSGEAEVTVPSGLATGTYTLKVFSEQDNGSMKTNYASDFSDITLDVTDITPPTLTEGAVERLDEKEAKVTFNSSEPGVYYYIVTDETVTPPDKDDVLKEKGTKFTELSPTIVLNNLTEGAKKIYIVVKDAANHTSDLLDIEIPADLTPRYSISVDPASVSFRTVEGYGALRKETVTVTNMGNQKITLEQPAVTTRAAAYFEISELSRTELDQKEEATFTVTPITGFKAGTYEETITVGVSGRSEQAEVAAKLEVQANVPGKHTITATCGEGGSINPSTRTVNEGDDALFTITPQTGYEIDAVIIDGDEENNRKSALSDRNEYTFKNVKENHTIHATFKRIDEKPAPAMHTVTVNASPAEGGTVAGGGTYQDGETVTVTAVAGEGYHFVRWTERDNQVSESATYQFSLVADRSLTAIFEKDPAPTPASHKVTVNNSYASQTGAGDYTAGQTVTIQAGTRANYRFDGWLTDDGITFANGNSATTTFAMPDKDVTVAAKWTYTGNNGGTNNGTANGGNQTGSGTGGKDSGGSGTVSDGKGGTYTGDDTPTAMWISAFCTSLGFMAVLGFLGWRRRKLYPEWMGQWGGLTEKEFGQKRK